ncbi:Cobalamin biosynthesis bifunctional protein CbiET [Methanocorpusculaceae archaeon Sp1]|uniref:Cobalamin biosynthesis bifunctional protein CbiET n=1 Tax=Methanorbis furvi TaxID=3028299 RepID=A0AAE4SC92_9EURY|nr:Cobalamin biosynthesis bifunctional protein CbiET [Methanocorpusculaceae archaeon Sp1]MDV0442295.1 Cobalamin biosynthesis bifunctional protein CbiET [Methanocorpusculaceae archaeon Ag1]
MELPGGPTQPEVMAVSLAKLGVRPGDTVADIGCGTGTVTKELANLAGPSGHVYAVDRRALAIACTKETCEGMATVETVEGEAMEFLSSSRKKIDCAFCGGSRDIAEIITRLDADGCRSIVVNAVLIETAVEAMHTMQSLGIFQEAVHLQISRSYELVERIMFKPINPIYIIHGGREC